MATLKLTNLLSYKNYFAAIATQHVSILGFKWGDEAVISNDNRSNATKNYLWAMPYDDAKYSGPSVDNTFKNKLARVSYLEVRNSAKFSDIDAQFVHCEEIIEDVISRILRDKTGRMVGSDWEMIATSINSFKTSPVQHQEGSTMWLGYDLEMMYQDNTNLQFDPTKWKDTL
jgi:hypothetical protein